MCRYITAKCVSPFRIQNCSGNFTVLQKKNENLFGKIQITFYMFEGNIDECMS